MSEAIQNPPPFALPITVVVTQDDINDGKPRSCRNCPLARAVSRSAGLPAEVTAISIELNLPGGRTREFSTPYTAGKFILNFDAGKKVAPFRFLITAGMETK